jgi:hypothetical protein
LANNRITAMGQLYGLGEIEIAQLLGRNRAQTG